MGDYGGRETPLSLLSMPVRLLRRLTGTACGRLRSRLARKGRFLPPVPPILPPTRFYLEDEPCGDVVAFLRQPSPESAGKAHVGDDILPRDFVEFQFEALCVLN